MSILKLSVDRHENYPEFANPYERAQERGAFVVESREGLLMCDLDTQEQLAKLLSLVSPSEPGKKPRRPFLVTSSPGGRAHGYVIDRHAHDEVERIMEQRALGSDPIREDLSMLQIKHGYSSAIVLFETASEYYRVQKWIWEHLRPTSADDLMKLPSRSVTEEVPF